MHSLLLLCLLSACPNGKCPLETPPAKPQAHASATNPLAAIDRLRAKMAAYRREAAALPHDADSAAARVELLVMADECQRKIDQIQDRLVSQHHAEAAARAKKQPLPKPGNLIAVYQTIAIRESLRSTYRTWR